MTNNKVYIFTYREMKLISEAFYRHFFEDQEYDPEEEGIQEFVDLGKKIGALPENWPDE